MALSSSGTPWNCVGRPWPSNDILGLFGGDGTVSRIDDPSIGQDAYLT